MTRDGRESGWYKWAVVAMLWLVCFFNYADRQGIFSVFPLLEQKDGGLGLSKQQLALIGSAFMWVYAGSGWLAGIVGDLLRRKTVILGGFLFWSVITLTFGFATEYWHLVALRAVEGLGEAFYFPAAMAMISAWHGKETRSKAMGIHQSSVYVGTIAGGAVAGVMGEHLGWRSSFFLFGGLGILVAVVLLVFLKEPSGGQLAAANTDDSGRKPATAFNFPMVTVLALVFIGANSVASIFLAWTPTFLHDKFTMSVSRASIYASAYLQTFSILGVLFGGWLADRLVRRFLGGRPMTQAIGLCCGMPFIFLVGWSVQIKVTLFALALFGFFKGVYDSNIWASVHDVVPAERRATAVGVMNSISWFGGGLAAFLIGYGTKWFSMSLMISTVSVIYLIFAFVMIWGVGRFMSGRSGSNPSVQNEIRER